VREQKGVVKAHQATGRPARQSSLAALGGSIDAPWGECLLLGPKSLFQAASVA
jgi:hypothetical protein